MSIQQGLCNYSGSLYAAWKGEVGDDRIWFSTLNGTTWAPQRNANDVDGAYSLLSSVGPGLAVLGTQMFLAWKGEQSDQTLWYSYLYDLGGSGWTVPSQIKGSWGTAASSIGPSLAAFNGKLYAAWKGASNESLWYSFFDGTKWNPQAQIAGATSSIGPSLATFNDKLYAAWSNSSDQSLWYSVLDGTRWFPPTQISGPWGTAASSIGPSLAPLGSNLYAAWSKSDQSLWYSTFADGSPNWTVPSQIKGSSWAAASSIGPSLATVGGNLYAMWKGGSDAQLWYAYFDGKSGIWMP